MWGGWRLRCLLYLSMGEWWCQPKPLMFTHMVASCFRYVVSHSSLWQLLCWLSAAIFWTSTLSLANTSLSYHCGKSRRNRTLPAIHWRRRCTQRVFVKMYICQIRRSPCGLCDRKVLRSRVTTDTSKLAQDAVISGRHMCTSQFTTALFAGTIRSVLQAVCWYISMAPT